MRDKFHSIVIIVILVGTLGLLVFSTIKEANNVKPEPAQLSPAPLLNPAMNLTARGTIVQLALRDTFACGITTWIALDTGGPIHTYVVESSELYNIVDLGEKIVLQLTDTKNRCYALKDVMLVKE